MKQSGGDIRVRSALGGGSVFEVYLPQIDGPAAHAPGPLTVRDVRGTETILLVDDDDRVRSVAQRALVGGGYTVLEAARPQDALRISASARFDLLVTDVVMPCLSGPELAERIAARHPHLAIVFISGFHGEALNDCLRRPRASFVQKPFTPRALLEAVRATLDRRELAAPAA